MMRKIRKGLNAKVVKNVNKVIRPKSRASARSKNVRQTDGQKLSFQKALLLQVSSLPFRAIKKRDKKP